MKEKLPSTVGKAPAVKLDWKGYYDDFAAKHGQYPVIWRGRLLFPDGWQYSSTDYRGPEWPPVEGNELRLALLFYWGRRRTIIRAELHRVTASLEGLTTLQRRLSGTLHSRHFFKDEEGRLRSESRPVDLSGLEGRRAWLEQDLADCDKHLTELKHGQPIEA